MLGICSGIILGLIFVIVMVIIDNRKNIKEMELEKADLEIFKDAIISDLRKEVAESRVTLSVSKDRLLEYEKFLLLLEQDVERLNVFPLDTLYLKGYDNIPTISIKTKEESNEKEVRLLGKKSEDIAYLVRFNLAKDMLNKIEKLRHDLK